MRRRIPNVTERKTNLPKRYNSILFVVVARLDLPCRSLYTATKHRNYSSTTHSVEEKPRSNVSFMRRHILPTKCYARAIAVLYAARLDEDLILIFLQRGVSARARERRNCRLVSKNRATFTRTCTAAKTPVLLLTSETEVAAMQFLG